MFSALRDLFTSNPVPVASLDPYRPGAIDPLEITEVLTIVLHYVGQPLRTQLVCKPWREITLESVLPKLAERYRFYPIIGDCASRFSLIDPLDKTEAVVKGVLVTASAYGINLTKDKKKFTAAPESFFYLAPHVDHFDVDFLYHMCQRIDFHCRADKLANFCEQFKKMIPANETVEEVDFFQKKAPKARIELCSQWLTKHRNIISRFWVLDLNTYIPKEIGFFTNLRELTLYQHHIRVFPPELFKLTQLATLKLLDIRSLSVNEILRLLRHMPSVQNITIPSPQDHFHLHVSQKCSDLFNALQQDFLSLNITVITGHPIAQVLPLQQVPQLPLQIVPPPQNNG